MQWTKRLSIAILFSIATVIITSFVISQSADGIFAKWDNLGSPQEKPITIIADGYVQTESGSVYRYENNQGCGNNCWIKVDKLPSELEKAIPVNEIDCIDHPSTYRFVDAKATCYYYAPTISMNITAIDKDNFVYSWGRSAGDGDILRPIPFICLSGIIGLVVGIIIAFPKVSS